MKDSPQPAKRRRYDAAFRAEALRLAGESRSTQAAARALNIDPTRIYTWQKQALTPVAAARGRRPWSGAGPSYGRRIAPAAGLGAAAGPGAGNLKKSHRQQTLEARYLRDRQPMSPYRFIEAQRSQYPVRLLCQVVAVPTSGYYAWQQAQKQAGSGESPAWEEALVQVFGRHQRRYGTRRLQVALRRKGYHVGRQRLRVAMRRRGLPALQPKAYTPRTTDSTHGLRYAPNRLLDQPKPTQANRVWVSDITYLPLANGDWAYRCAYQDMASKQVVGWQVGATMPEELITSAWQRAFWAQPPAPGLLVHSDRGGQYCGNAYRQLLRDHQALRSQSRRGDCYDNAQAESLWSRLKTEVLELRERPVFADLADAQASVTEYFDYYNHERLHSSIDYQTPYHTHQQLLQLNALNCPA